MYGTVCVFIFPRTTKLNVEALKKKATFFLLTNCSYNKTFLCVFFDEKKKEYLSVGTIYKEF